MLRAVWMNDKAAFDRCYRWTEENLSRKNYTGDNLLAWHWKDGTVIDQTPASDADIDYALALIFADSLWSGDTPDNLEDYGYKAKIILDDVLELETYSTSSSRLYLSPWPIDMKEKTENYPVNPSYYSPAHFRIFYNYTKDKKWLGLVDTAYYVLDRLQNEFNGKKGVGLVPDWCRVDNLDNFTVMPDKGEVFGYEAIRIPFRVGLDYFWFGEPRAKKVLNNFSGFLINHVETYEKVFCEYNYNGIPIKKHENPAFYACYYYALAVDKSRYFKLFLSKNRSNINKDGANWFYYNKDDYYLNCLAWLADGLNAGIIKNLSK